MTLVQEYAQSKSEPAFTELVARHVNLVYSVALRHVRDPHLAEEITQGIFVILPRKAESLNPKTILRGWLCRTARFVSANTLKTQRNRQLWEQESRMQSSLENSGFDTWNQIGPLLDEADVGALEFCQNEGHYYKYFAGVFNCDWVRVRSRRSCPADGPASTYLSRWNRKGGGSNDVGQD